VSFNGSANITLPTVNTSGDQTIAGIKTFTTRLNVDTAQGEILITPTGWRASDRAAIKVRSKGDTPAEIDLRNTSGSFEPGWHLSARGGTESRTLQLYRFGMTTAGVADSSSFTLLYSFAANGTLSATTFSGALSGNATTATTLQTARTIGGVSFNGSANINLPGVNAAGNQNTTGSAASVSGTTTAALPTAALASGTANSTTFLRGDRTWASIASSSISISDTVPGSPTAGNLWWNSNLAQLFIYYNDGDSQQWVTASKGVPGPAGPAGPGVAVGGTTGQVLAKTSSTDYATTWVDPFTTGKAIAMTIVFG
jgi:hypothetical protein